MSTPASEAAALAPPRRERKVLYFDVGIVPDGYAQLGLPFIVSSDVRNSKREHSRMEPVKSLDQVRRKAKEQRPDADAFMIGDGKLVYYVEQDGIAVTKRDFPVVAYKIRGEEKDRDDGDIDGGGGG